MPELNDEQIDFIWTDIRKRGVYTESLAQNLLDHICCFIEEQPDDGKPFGEIYSRALESFGQKGLHEIQDETLYLINKKHFIAMKKFMFLSGAVASVCLLIGSLMKLLHWPGAGILFISSAVLFIFLFIPYYIFSNFQEQTEKKGKLIAVLGTVSAALLCIGTVFKIMHWPGASAILILFVLSFLIFLPLYLINGLRNPLTKTSTLSNGFLFASIGSFALLSSFRQPSQSTSEAMQKIQKDEQALLVQISNLQSDEKSKTAFFKFNSAFEKLIVTIDQSYPNSIPGEGSVVEKEMVSQINADAKTAVDALNKSMENTAGWKPVVFTPVRNAIAGNIKFQLIQFQCKVAADMAEI